MPLERVKTGHAPEVDALGTLTRRLCRFDMNSVVRISGTIKAISEGRVCVRGLEHVVRLGECVSFEDGCCGFASKITNGDVVVVPAANGSILRLGQTVHVKGAFAVAPDESWLGRVVDPFGQPLDGKGPLRQGEVVAPVTADPPPALSRAPIGDRLWTGVTAIDVFTPICAGQRLGLFAGSGVGKSSLLGMMAKNASADVVVVALVGERGREVRELLEVTMIEARSRLVAVVATADTDVVARKYAPYTAMAVAEAFRAAGHSVLLMIDSITRFAWAQRDFAMAGGELPVARGFPPSVMGELARLLERAGPGRHGEGTITLLATVLIDGDDHNDPIADAVRGIVDGHIVLDRAIGMTGRWPAIDLRGSLSRLSDRAWTPEERHVVREALSLIHAYETSSDLRALGELKPGHDPVLDRAVRVAPLIYSCVSQDLNAPAAVAPFAELRRVMA